MTLPSTHDPDLDIKELAAIARGDRVALASLYDRLRRR